MGIFDLFSKKNKEEETPEMTTEKEVSKAFFGYMNPEAEFWDSFLTNEAKFRHQDVPVKRSSKDEPITLRYILEELLNIPSSDIGSMTVVNNDVFWGNTDKTEIVSPSEVLAFKPCDMLLDVQENGDILPYHGRNTILIISYRPSGIVYHPDKDKKDKSKLCTDNSIIMFLRGIGPYVGETAYMRVSVMIPNFSDPDDFRTFQSKNAPFTTSFVLCFDIVPPQGKLQRYDEIEKSLKEKSERGENLTAEERTVLNGITYSTDIGHSFGYGVWLVSERRFADALMCLMKVFDRLKKIVVTDHDRRLHEIFKTTCFNIGLCLNEIGQFERAFYYFSLALDSNKPIYIIEYICSLTNSGSPIALEVVSRYMSEFRNGKRQVDSRESALLYDFLERRLAYLYVEYKMWDNARDLLNQMMGSPTNHDFAVSELGYIDRVTGSNDV